MYSVTLFLLLDNDEDASLTIKLPFVPVTGMLLTDLLFSYSLVIGEVNWCHEKQEFLLTVKAHGSQPDYVKIRGYLAEYGWEQ